MSSIMSNFNIMFRRVYTAAEIDMINKQCQPVVQKYAEYFSAGCPMIDIASDTKKVAIAYDILMLVVYNSLVYAQTVGLPPRSAIALARTNLPLVYVQDVLLNPILLQETKDGTNS